MKIRDLTGTALLAVLAGCASFSPDGGMSDVRNLAQARIGAPARGVASAADGPAARARVDTLLREPLDADVAVEIALLNNAGLQARLAEVGVAEADLVQAGMLRNPVLAYSNKRNAEVTQIERSFLVNVAALLTMPLSLALEEQRFAQAKVAAASEVVAMAAATREAFFRAVAAQEMVAYYGQVKLAAEAGRELAQRMAQAGNFSKLAQMREELFYADATTGLAHAQTAAVTERERLTRLLGLAEAASAFALPPRLPGLPAAPFATADAERTALDSRLDVHLATLEADASTHALDLARTTRFVNVLEVGYVNESETGERRKNGYEIVLELPLFDWGGARVARAEARHRQALARAAETAAAARSEVRASYATYRSAFELARRYRDEIVPLRKRMGDETALRYNAMLIGVFELLADAREQVRSVTAAIEATRDFWIADTALQLALAGRSPGTGTAGPARPAAAGTVATGTH